MISRDVAFPEVLDNTILAMYSECPWKVFLAHFHHWKIRGQSVHLHAGGAFAHGLEAARRAYFEQGLPPDDAVAVGVGALLAFYGNFECPEDSAKSATRMAGALEFYFARDAGGWPLGEDPAVPITLPGGKRGIEFSFVTPLPIKHPVTGNPLLLSGRADVISKFAGGVYIQDEKTSTSLGATWAKKWDLSSQFSGYCWAAEETGIHVDGCLIRGISILKTKYDRAQALTYRPRWMLDEWLENTCNRINDMIQSWKTWSWQKDFGESCSHYGGCMFRQCCISEDPEPWLDMYYERRAWNPITRSETALTVPSSEAA